MTISEKGARRQQILQTLAAMLENPPKGKITTAVLAKSVGVSEAALYRHFPSKGKMYEALIDFTEETLFSRFSSIKAAEGSVQEKCRHILSVTLTFAERNPGISRLLASDTLIAEAPKLSLRIQQLFERMETQLKQIIKEAEYKEKIATSLSATNAANLLVIMAEGKIRQYIRSSFQAKPLTLWQDQWRFIEQSLFVPVDQSNL